MKPSKIPTYMKFENKKFERPLVIIVSEDARLEVSSVLALGKNIGGAV